MTARLTEAQFMVAVLKAKTRKSVVKRALRAHLVNGENLNAVAERYGVNRANLYACLKRMGL